MDVTNISIGLEINGALYLVQTSKVDINLLVNVMASCFPDGTLPVIPAPEGSKLYTLSELLNG